MISARSTMALSHSQRNTTMFTLSQTRLSSVILLNVIAAGALVALAFVNTPVAAGGADAKMRPAGPHEPILASVGVRRVVASFATDFGHCAVNASVWDSIEAQADSAIAHQRQPDPGQLLHIDSLEAETKSLESRVWRRCQDAADSRRKLAVDATAHRVKSADGCGAFGRRVRSPLFGDHLHGRRAWHRLHHDRRRPRRCRLSGCRFGRRCRLRWRGCLGLSRDRRWRAEAALPSPGLA